MKTEHEHLHPSALFAPRLSIRCVCAQICDCAEPLDTLAIDRSLLASPAAFLKLMVLLSAGRFAAEPFAASSAVAALPTSQTRWLRGRSFFSIGAYVASRLEIQILSDLQTRLGARHGPQAALAAIDAGPKRVSAAWWASMEPTDRLQLLSKWTSEVRVMLQQRRQLLSLKTMNASATVNGAASAPELAALMELVETLSAPAFHATHQTPIRWAIRPTTESTIRDLYTAAGAQRAPPIAPLLTSNVAEGGGLPSVHSTWQDLSTLLIAGLYPVPYTLLIAGVRTARAGCESAGGRDGTSAGASAVRGVAERADAARVAATGMPAQRTAGRRQPEAAAPQEGLCNREGRAAAEAFLDLQGTGCRVQAAEAFLDLLYERPLARVGRFFDLCTTAAPPVVQLFASPLILSLCCPTPPLSTPPLSAPPLSTPPLSTPPLSTPPLSPPRSLSPASMAPPRRLPQARCPDGGRVCQTARVGARR